jgi:hypothetical protein
VSPTRKVQPYGHLSDPELNQLVDGAVELRLRMAQHSPGEVRETLIAHGCPKAPALRMVTDPLMRPMAARFHIDVQDALLGDPEAKARMEWVIAGWERLRERGAPQTAEQAEREDGRRA